MNFNAETAASDLESKSLRVAERFSDNINLIANEPALALFRIQEHVRATLPQFVEKKYEVMQLQKQIQGAVFDTEYAINAVKGMESSKVHFSNIQELMKNAMFMKQQLKYKNTKKKEQARLAVPIQAKVSSAQGIENLLNNVSLDSSNQNGTSMEISPSSN